MDYSPEGSSVFCDTFTKQLKGPKSNDIGYKNCQIPQNLVNSDTPVLSHLMISFLSLQKCSLKKNETMLFVKLG